MNKERSCQLCGETYLVDGKSNGEFTTITVSYHDNERTDFSESVCADCGDELLADVVAEVRDDE
jgi:hypothetical protein